MPGDFKTHRDGHNHSHRSPVDFSKFDQNLEEMPLSLNNTVVMHPNGPKCPRNEQIQSLLGQDTIWVLLNMVWSHYFAVFH